MTKKKIVWEVYLRPHTLTKDDAGHKITVRATYKDNAGHDENPK